MLKLVKKYLKGYRLISVLGPVFKLLESAIEIILPLIVADIINVGIKERADIGYVQRGGIIMIALYFAAFVFSVICQYFAAVSAFGFGTNLRRGLYRHINSLPLSKIDYFQTSTLITRISLDSSNVQNALNRFIRLVTRAPFILIGALIMSVRINPTLSIIFFAAAFLLFVSLILIMKGSSPRLRKINISHDNITLLTRENLSGARVVRAAGGQDEEEREFKAAAGRLKTQSVALGLITAISSPLTYLIINAGIILLIYFGAFQISYGSLQDGDIIALINYMMQILNAMLVLAILINLFSKAGASAKRINQVLDAPPENKDGDPINDSLAPDVLTNSGRAADATDNTEFCEALRFKNVSVCYGDNKPNLTDISFSLKKGETLGIIGGTGSGKTTLVSLIPKLYDYEGEISLFGQDLKKLSAVSVRQAIALVPQKAVLFSGTVRDNMLFSNPDATDDEIMQALKAADCGFISSPAAVTARGGANFSGGQRQRLTLARAIVKKPSLLILDDSTSALDYSTEATVRKRLNAFKTMTKIIVTQRAGSIKNADLIIVLEGGRAVGIGKHADLIKECEIYREINEIQGERND